MAVQEFGSAGPVNFLLSRLGDVLVNETRLLRGVRWDLQFIYDEMESMNAFLLKSAEANGDDDHQVVAWTNQVKSVLISSQYYVNEYVRKLDGGHRPICCGPVGRFTRLLATIPARHQLATHIRDLKIQAREVGERQQRYGVTVPSVAAAQPQLMMTTYNQSQPGLEPEAPADDLGDSRRRRRRTIVEDDYDLFTEAATEIISWMEEEQDSGDVIAPEAVQPKVIPIVGPPGTGKTTLAQKVYDIYPSRSSSSSSSSCKVAWVSLGREQSVRKALETILAIIDNKIEGIENISSWQQDAIESMIKRRLECTKVLLVLDDVHSKSFCRQIRSVLNYVFGAGSAVLLVTTDTEVAKSCSPHRIYNFDDLFEHLKESAVNILLDRALSLHANNTPDIEALRDVLRSIIRKCSPYLFSMNMFLRCLYVNPDRKIEELQDLCNSLHDSSASTNVDKMIDFCYRSLPSHYRNCLAYLAISPTHDNTFKRSSLVRQWIAEGLIISRRNDVPAASEIDVAKRCYDALCDQKFLLPAVGSVPAGSPNGGSRHKVCMVHVMVFGFLSSIGEVQDNVDPELFPDMVKRISVQNGVRQTCAREDHNIGGVVTHLKSLSSDNLQLLKVLDLEGSTGFEEKHLKTICSVAVHLRYLSLRNVPGVGGLPGQIQNLQALETLDIRGTDVTSLDSVLCVKNLLVGRMDGSSFSTVKIPRDIRSARNIEVLFHVDVSDRADLLMHLGRLLKLRKLGVVVGPNQDSVMRLLFSQIEMLRNCLRSLSIRLEGANPGTGYNMAGSNMLSPPRMLQILRIHGAIFGLPHWIRRLHQLAKISLCNTCLTDVDLHILGKLPRLRSLFLRYAMTRGTTLVFPYGEFKEMQDLVIEDAELSVLFIGGTASKLERIVFKVNKMLSLHGVDRLQSLKELEMVGHDEDTWKIVRSAVRSNPNTIRYIYNGQVEPY